MLDLWNAPRSARNGTGESGERLMPLASRAEVGAMLGWFVQCDLGDAGRVRACRE